MLTTMHNSDVTPHVYLISKGTELRAFNNMGWNRDAGGTTTEKIGLTGYGPNINNPRDPRFGRTSELPSEDPYHAGQ